MKPRKNITKEILTKLYCIDKNNFKKIGEILGYHPVTIATKIKKFGIPIRPTQGFRHEPYYLTDLQKEVINGALLGDGMICGGNFIYASKSEEHVNFVWKYFKNIMSPKNKERLSKVSQFDKRTNKTYTRFFFNSQTNECFKELRKHWYRPQKIIPENIKLTPLTCLIWYLGDGGLVFSEKHNVYCLMLATNAFKKEDLETFILPQLFEFKAKLTKREHNQYCIRIPRSKVKLFLDYIGICPVKDYAHKWRRPPNPQKHEL